MILCFLIITSQILIAHGVPCTNRPAVNNSVSAGLTMQDVINSSRRVSKPNCSANQQVNVDLGDRSRNHGNMQGFHYNHRHLDEEDLVSNYSSPADNFTTDFVFGESHWRQTVTNRRGYFTSTCATGNSIDDCWRCDPNWARNRKRLADCAIGFGREAIGGKYGDFYVVNNSGQDDPVNPKPGTLRHAAIQTEPLWIIFSADMTIKLKEELIMNSYKTIDGRGHNVHIGAGGACITIQYVSHVIIHGIHVHDCKPAGNAMVRDSPTHYGWRTVSDGDGISLFGASHVWIDHVSLSNCADGLIDAIMGSTAITISNNYFSNHDKVMLLGHSDSYFPDKNMQVTIAFNHFGEGLVQRMPRCRHGYFEIVNNDYTHWEMYAIGGSAAPTINSKGNRYIAPSNRFSKDVTMRIASPEWEWARWDWRSEGDLFVNGAFFTPSGAGASANLQKAATIGPKPSNLVALMTANAGALSSKGGILIPSHGSQSPYMSGSSTYSPYYTSSSTSSLPLNQFSSYCILLSLLISSFLINLSINPL